MTDEASQSTASTEATPGDTPMPPPDGDDAVLPNLAFCSFVFLFLFIFFVAQCVLGF